MVALEILAMYNNQVIFGLLSVSVSVKIPTCVLHILNEHLFFSFILNNNGFQGWTMVPRLKDFAVAFHQSNMPNKSIQQFANCFSF